MTADPDAPDADRPADGPQDEHILLPPLLLAAIVALLYFPSSSYPLTNWDDYQFIRDNPLLQPGGADLLRLFGRGGVPGEMLYIPLTYVSFLVTGSEPGFVHLVNVVLHVLNGVLVFRLCVGLGLRPLPAVLGAGLFAVHPLQVETVAWAMGRKDLLATAFALLACLVYLGADRPSPRRRAAVASLYALSLLAKPGVIVLPAVLLAFDYYRRGSLSRRDLIAQVPLAVIGVAVYLVNAAMPKAGAPTGPDLGFRIMAVPDMLQGWLQRFALAETPCPFYTWPAAIRPLPTVVGLLLVAAGVGGALLAIRRDRRLLATALAMVGLAMAPAVVATLQYREFITGDRYGYFAFAGIAFGLAGGAASLRARAPLALAALAAAVVICGLFAARQQRVWASSETVWQAVLARDASCLTAYSNLALAYQDSGNPEAALATGLAGLDVDADHVPLRVNVGHLLIEQRALSRAQPHFAHALALQPNNSRALKGMGDVLAADRPDAAVAAYERALELQPDYGRGWLALGRLHSTNDRAEAALAAYAEAAAAMPRSGAPHYNRGVVLERQGKAAEAVAAYERAVAIQPDYAVAHYNLGALHERQGELRAAEQAYQRALSFAPGHVEALINLGNVFLRTKRLAKAREMYLNALRVAPDTYPAVHLNLTRIYLARGQLQRARAEYDLAVAKGASDPGLAQHLAAPEPEPR
jgi:tetratricopeptide (TPR) repeat protein